LRKKPCKGCSFCLTEIASLNYWQEKADPFAADAPRGGGQRQKPADNKRPSRNAGGQSRQAGSQQSCTPEGDLQTKLAALKRKFKWIDSRVKKIT
jgi:hypothetical protein